MILKSQTEVWEVETLCSSIKLHHSVQHSRKSIPLILSAIKFALSELHLLYKERLHNFKLLLIFTFIFYWQTEDVLLSVFITATVWWHYHRRCCHTGLKKQKDTALTFFLSLCDTYSIKHFVNILPCLWPGLSWIPLSGLRSFSDNSENIRSFDRMGHLPPPFSFFHQFICETLDYWVGRRLPSNN